MRIRGNFMLEHVLVGKVGPLFRQGHARGPDRKGKIMALYEHVFLARQDISAHEVETQSKQLKGIIESFGGKIEKVEYWGVKSLAYRIKKNRKAHFTLMNI